jgi:hypothetical protein
MLNLDQMIIESDPEFAESFPSASSNDAQDILNRVLANRSTPRQRRTRIRVVAAVGIVAVAGLVAIGVLPDTSTHPPAASAAPFLRSAAKAVLTTATFGTGPAVIPQPGQYIYSEKEDPSGTLVQTWLSFDGTTPGQTTYTSQVPGYPPTGTSPLPACSLAQAQATGCFPEVGYFPNMPTDPSALVAYFNSLGFTDITSTTNPDPSNPVEWDANDLAKGLMYWLGSAYLTPSQHAAIFNLMAETPGFTIVPNMADAIGRVGVGVEWNYQGSAGALIFDPTTYALLGVRTWPGAAIMSAPYEGDALLGISIVNAIPSN